jgi:hypothetical protein
MQEQTQKIVSQLSSERFEACRYNGEDDDATLRRVKWNTALSETLYTPLQGLEVSIRNSVHRAISLEFKSPDWILVPTGGYLRRSEQEMMESAIAYLGISGKRVTAGHMVSELKFGFWSSLFDTHYDKLWHKIIKQVFPMMPNPIRKRKEASRRINSIRRLRNAVSHHHSIWHWRDLRDRHAEIYMVLDWIEPEFSSFIRSQDRFLLRLNAGP